jgi:membrane-associated phospholipid phosphatase
MGRWILLTALWAVLVALAMVVDRPVAVWMHERGIDSIVRTNLVTRLIKSAGTFWFTIVVVVGCLALKKIRLVEGIFVMSAVAVSACNWLMKWSIGRTRPFKLTGPDQPQPFLFSPFHDGLIGLFHQKNLSFPSGHACTGFATAMAIALVRPKWAGVFFGIALLVGAERIFENAHYLSDVIAGAGVGIAGVLLVRRLVNPQVDVAAMPADGDMMQRP